MNRTDNLFHLTDQCFAVKRAKIEGKGEDSYLFSLEEDAAVIGVFDGCGGSGAKIYREFNGHTGAYISSRVLARSTYEWFIQSDRNEKNHYDKEKLKEQIDRKLGEFQEAVNSESMLMGSLRKAFPSTLSVAVIQEEKPSLNCRFYWAGDSRGYILSPKGLYQITRDDVPNPDAMANLREDAVMTNVISASCPYKIHERTVTIEMPCIIITATDGCFGYLRTPMEFEKLLLETLAASQNIATWQQNMDERLKEVSGDDYTMCLLSAGFENFGKLKNSFLKRLSYLKKNYPLSPDTSEMELFLQWEKYKVLYESKSQRQVNKT